MKNALQMKRTLLRGFTVVAVAGAALMNTKPASAGGPAPNCPRNAGWVRGDEYCIGGNINFITDHIRVWYCEPNSPPDPCNPFDIRIGIRETRWGSNVNCNSSDGSFTGGYRTTRDVVTDSSCR